MFLHPLDVVTIVVFVVTMADAVFFTSVVSSSCVLVNSKTFLGARSSGRILSTAPLSHSSSNSNWPSSSSDVTLDLVLMLDIDSRAVTLELVVEVSELTKAARTSEGSDDHASSMDLDKVEGAP